MTRVQEDDVGVYPLLELPLVRPSSSTAATLPQMAGRSSAPAGFLAQHHATPKLVSLSPPLCSPAFGISQSSWQDALDAARGAMVSYPLLVSEEGARRVAVSQWRARRSFIARTLTATSVCQPSTLGSLFTLSAAELDALSQEAYEAAWHNASEPLFVAMNMQP
jgi:hypothetical protein